jgi:hypothetical protein
MARRCLVANRKPRSAVDRLPADFEQPRKPSPEEGGGFGAVLVLTPLTEAARAARNTRALAVLRYYQAEDPAEALGLVGRDAEPGAPAVKPRHTPRPIDFRCPQCTQPAGQRCVSKFGIETAFHKARKQLIEEAA